MRFDTKQEGELRLFLLRFKAEVVGLAALWETPTGRGWVGRQGR